MSRDAYDLKWFREAARSPSGQMLAAFDTLWGQTDRISDDGPKNLGVHRATNQDGAPRFAIFDNESIEPASRAIARSFFALENAGLRVQSGGWREPLLRFGPPAQLDARVLAVLEGVKRDAEVVRSKYLRAAVEAYIGQQFFYEESELGQGDAEWQERVEEAFQDAVEAFFDKLDAMLATGAIAENVQRTGGYAESFGRSVWPSEPCNAVGGTRFSAWAWLGDRTLVNTGAFVSTSCASSQVGGSVAASSQCA